MGRVQVEGQVRFEHLDEAFGIGTATPRLSWRLSGGVPDWEAAAYELEAEREGAPRQVARVASAEQVLVPWPFAPLRSRERATVRVRVQGNDGSWTEWSEPATVEAGLLEARDWSARFVSPLGLGAPGDPAPVLERAFTAGAGAVRARLYLTAHGVYVPSLNGERVGDQVLAPGWTSYPHRLCYQTFDMTGLLREGENHLSVLLGNGWFRGRLVRRSGHYGDRLALLAQLEVEYADGRRETVGTDAEWRAGSSGILFDDLYDGQRTDLRVTGVATADVEVVEGSLERLVAPEAPPVRVTQVMEPVAITTSPSGRLLVDFGQNLVGWVRLRVRNPREGSEVTVRHAEVLEHGELGVRPLRTAKATDSYLLAAADEVTLEPSLTFHGFRYAEITGVPDVQPQDVRAVVVGSDLRRTGWFDCSDADLDRVHENTVWSMRGNFLSVPTDCPQRDERLGWTGDIQIFAPTACFLHDSAGFLSSWLADLASEQHPDGSVPHVIPDVLYTTAPAAAAWGDAATVVPWVLYERYGDVRILERQYPSMRAWVERVSALAGDDHLWTGSFQYGDWVDPASPPEEPGAARADHDLVATAHLVRSAEVLARAATVLGRTADAERYAGLAAATRNAFAREYVTPAGRIQSDAPTAYALALAWDLLPDPEQRRRAADRLADLIRAEGFRIGTGFVGTPVITDALTRSGYVDLAYRLLLQRACPSWLYPVTMGATTIWERWDSLLPDGSINPGQMTSFNHYALGAVADWLHRSVAGLAPGAAGYRRLMVRPVPGPGLTHASARHLTPYGEAAVAWRRSEGRLHVELTVPTGVRAAVELPGQDPLEVGPGQHTWTVADSVGAPQALTEGSTVRQLMDAPDAWREASRLLTDNGLVDDEFELSRRLLRYLDRRAVEVPRLVARRATPDVLQEVSRRLEGILTAG